MIGVQLGSTHLSYASRELAANEPTLKLVVYNRVGEMVQDLKNGRLQVILLDQSTAEPIAAKEQLFKKLMPAMESSYVILFKKRIFTRRDQRCDRFFR